MLKVAEIFDDFIHKVKSFESRFFTGKLTAIIKVFKKSRTAQIPNKLHFVFTNSLNIETKKLTSKPVCLLGYFRSMYPYLKALHIIFIATWFAGLFYIPRLFIYNTEAAEKEPQAREVLRAQFAIMMKRLWYGITWPSAVLTLIFGLSVLFMGGWHKILFEPSVKWLLVKLILVVFLYAYHFSLHHILKSQLKGVFTYTSQQLRIWNEVATIFLVAIVMLVVVKQNISLLWGLGGLVAFIVLLMSAIRVYKSLR